MPYDKNFSRLTNGNLFMNGNNLYGKTEEVNLPEAIAKMMDHKALGAVGTIELTSGFDKMEAGFKLNGPVAEVAAQAADVKTSNTFTYRGNLEAFNGQSIASEVPYVVTFRGTFKTNPMGNSKQHENIELNYKLNVTYVKLMIDGVAIFELDVINNIHKVMGKDILANYRSNLGL